jgi:hypothetical protein
MSQACGKPRVALAQLPMRIGAKFPPGPDLFAG